MVQRVLEATVAELHRIENEDFINRKDCANAFISFSSLLEDLIKNGQKEDVLKENLFFQVYESFLRPFFDIIYSLDKDSIEESLKFLYNEINSIISHNIIEGLNNGDISIDELEG